jgi:hypothetical protein
MDSVEPEGEWTCERYYTWVGEQIQAEFNELTAEARMAEQTTFIEDGSTA